MRCTKILFALLPALAILVGVVPQAGAAISVDQSLADWGLTISGGQISYDSAYGYSGYPAGTEKSGTADIGGMTIYYDIEDSYDYANHSSYISPLYGGQDYDAEFLGVATDGVNLYIAISSGQRPDNGSDYFAPGDIRIDCGTTTFGIEVGGAVNSGVTQITEGDLGATFDLDQYGNTDGVTSLATQTAGSVWLTDLSDWEKGITSGSVTSPVETQLVSPSPGNLMGMADFSYFFGSEIGQHAFIELAIPLSYFDGETVTWVGWGPSCGNDELYRSVSIDWAPPEVPEPGSMLIWAVMALGFGGCGWRRWRRR